MTRSKKLYKFCTNALERRLIIDCDSYKRTDEVCVCARILMLGSLCWVKCPQTYQFALITFICNNMRMVNRHVKKPKIKIRDKLTLFAPKCG